MILKSRLGWAAIVALLFLPSLTLGAREVTHATPLPEAVLRQKIVNYLRNYGYYPPNIQVDTGPLESSQNPAYYECHLSAAANGKSASEIDSISKNGRYLARSAMYYLGPDAKAGLLRSIRDRFKLGTEWQLSAGPLQPSAVPGFFQANVTAERNGKKQSQDFYVTDDKRFAVLGQLFILRTPKEVESLINTRNQPHSGPLDAPVTLVEYADLECPHCAELQGFLENVLLPRYGNKVRLIYKDFPIPSHDWSREAAIANQCSYEIDPSAFVPYRTSIFAQQAAINVTNVREMLLNLGEQAGINRLRLAACLDAKTSLPRVEADYNEALRLQVFFTPTCFIDGRPVVGNAPEDYYRIIDEELRRAK
ncbi:MAG: DsbA family protein [Terriglobia bacterium]